MRKLFFLFALALSSATLLVAQDDCVGFFPKEEGTTLVKSNYDANKNVLSTITYVVNKTYQYPGETERQIGFVISDAFGKVIDEGDMEVRCKDGSFYMKMTNVALTPGILKILTDNTEIAGEFLDYPDIFSTPPSEDVFKIDRGEFSIRSKSDRKELVNIKVSNRKFMKEEIVTTPAGTFNAYKVTFDVNVTENKKVTKYKGTEWYADNAGIVKSEVYDANKKLVSYSELTTLKFK